MTHRHEAPPPPPLSLSDSFLPFSTGCSYVTYVTHPNPTLGGGGGGGVGRREVGGKRTLGMCVLQYFCQWSKKNSMLMSGSISCSHAQGDQTLPVWFSPGLMKFLLIDSARKKPLFNCKLCQGSLSYCTSSFSGQMA